MDPPRPCPALAVAAVAAALAAAPAGAQPAAPELRLRLVVHLTSLGGAPVIPPAEVPDLVEELNRYYRGAGICFGLEETRQVQRSADLKTYRERHAFISFAVPQAVNVFLVHSIYDPSASESTIRTAARFGFVPGHWLSGAHIEEPRRTPSTYALVLADAGASTLAHEIGHILGEGHSGAPGNLMGYGEERSAFDDRQLRDLRARARRELRTGALREAEGCGALKQRAAQP